MAINALFWHSWSLWPREDSVSSRLTKAETRGRGGFLNGMSGCWLADGSSPGPNLRKAQSSDPGVSSFREATPAHLESAVAQSLEAPIALAESRLLGDVLVTDKQANGHPEHKPVLHALACVLSRMYRGLVSMPFPYRTSSEEREG